MIKLNLYKLTLPVLLIFSSWVQATPTFSNIYIFGDSLSDTGNLASIIGDLPQPYYMNRITNGPVSVETLTEKLGHSANASLHLLGLNAGTNYSVARASAAGEEQIDLNTQVLSFQVNHGFVAPSDALYVLFIGGNDVRSALVAADNKDAKSIIKAAAKEVKSAIKNLSIIGAKSFLVVNAPNIGIIPETQIIAAATESPELIGRGRMLSNKYRKALHKAVENLQEHNDIEITEFDLFRFFNRLVKNADKYGFTNTTDACFSSVTFTFHPDCNFGLNFDQFIFFDEIHPTARVHSIVGDSMAESFLDDDEYDYDKNDDEHYDDD
ncbi:MAG: SGNH/GDSL hydrolase family protein [Gammaproteobacteria bacterium]|nr:SGNH/GDSL hydrolase family protein [Gammaproteobacteria bacterium]